MKEGQNMTNEDKRHQNKENLQYLHFLQENDEKFQRG
jgi:hypothetical protein